MDCHQIQNSNDDCVPWQFVWFTPISPNGPLFQYSDYPTPPPSTTTINATESFSVSSTHRYLIQLLSPLPLLLLLPLLQTRSNTIRCCCRYYPIQHTHTHTQICLKYSSLVVYYMCVLLPLHVPHAIRSRLPKCRVLPCVYCCSRTSYHRLDQYAVSHYIFQKYCLIMLFIKFLFHYAYMCTSLYIRHPLLWLSRNLTSSLYTLLPVHTFFPQYFMCFSLLSHVSSW